MILRLVGSSSLKWYLLEDLRIPNIVVEFNKRKQNGTYEEYVEHFNELKACLLMNDHSKYTEEYFMGSFLSGLSEEL